MSHSRIETICLFLFTILLVGGMARTTAAQGSTAYIDEHNRFILNGEPFFPIGLYVAQCSTEADHSFQLNQIENSPFDTLMNDGINSCGTPATDVEINDYLDQLQLRNLKLIFSLWDYFADCADTGDLSPTVVDTITHKVNTFKSHPAVICWYMQEERDPAVCLTELETGYSTISGLDANHPVWSVIDGWPLWNFGWLTQLAHTTDIVGVDPYPIPFYPITDVSQMADEATSTGKPLWLVPQLFNWADYGVSGGRWPTKEEMRAMTYLAVNHGAKGLIYYSYYNILADQDYDNRWPQIKEIASEIAQLRPVFLSIYQTNVNDIVCDNADIDFKLMREGKTYYLFAVNTQAVTINGVSFQINQALESSVIDVLFEGRQVTLIDSTFTDGFTPYEVHVYYWEGPSDNDGDGVDSIEEWGPDGTDPNYDGNGDGFADSEQANVASCHTNDDQHYVTISVPDPATLYNCETLDNPHPSDAPVDTSFPYGFFAFKVNGLSAGDCTEVTLLLPKNSDVNTYYKYGCTSSDTADHWYEFMFDGQTGAEIFQESTRTRIVLDLCDGKRGDDDLVADGKIVDVGGPGGTITSGGGGSGGGGSGGCFVATAAFGSYVDPHVQVIKDFRDEYLLTNMPGSWFVGMYNTYGPFWADFLNAHPRCKPFVRLSLMPVVGISYFVLNTSLATKLLTGFLLLGFMVICLCVLRASNDPEQRPKGRGRLTSSS